ncbi:MAG: cytochrome c maturation protein CcmE [Deinococcales bacterium]
MAKPKRLIYSLLGIALLAVAAVFIYQALAQSLVYFILPSEYAQNPSEYDGNRIRLAGLVQQNSVNFDSDKLSLDFTITDGIQSYQVSHKGSPPELFKVNTGVVVEGNFEGTVFHSNNLLIKHSEVYEAPENGMIDVNVLKESLQ